MLGVRRSGFAAAAAASRSRVLARPQRVGGVLRKRFSDLPPPKQPVEGINNVHEASGRFSRQSTFFEDRASINHLLERVGQLDKRLSYEGWHTLRWTSLILAVSGATFWFFREDVSSGAGDAASEVARRTLENENVQAQASELARGVVYELLNDKRALQLSAQFLNDVIQREETKTAVLELIRDILGRKQTEVALRDLVANVLTHPQSAEKATKFLQNVLARPDSRDALITVLSGVLQESTTQIITSDFFKNVMATDTFVAAANKLGTDSVYYLLNDEELKMAAVLWCNTVLNDPALQNTAGEAVWAAVKGAFVPWSRSKPTVHKLKPIDPPETGVIVVPKDLT